MNRRMLLPAITEVGPGSVNQLPRILGHLGVSRPLVLLDPGIPQESASVLVAHASAAGTVVTLTCPPGEPSTDSADLIAREARVAGCDCVVALGGGSVMDLGKAVSMLIGQTGKASSYQGPDLVDGAGLPVVCVPTTAGSGAEATKSAVLTNLDAQVKRGINALGVLPSAVILDPHFLVTLPRRPRIAALLDATAHATESFIGRSSWLVSEMASLTSFPHLGKHLRHDGEVLSVEEAQDALLGSYFAGMSICNAETGAVHALAYPFTEYHAIPHAYAVGALLPEIMDLQRDHCAESLQIAATHMGFVGTSAFLARLADVRDSLGVMEQIRDICRNEEALQQIVERSLSLTGALDNSPMTWTVNEVGEILMGLQRG